MTARASARGGKMAKKGFLFPIFLTALFFLAGRPAFSAEPSIVILGDVVGKGSTEMKTAFEKWIPIGNKVYPFMDQSRLRTGDGTMSLLFRDRATMEIGRKTELVVTGSRGNYVVNLDKGTVAFSVPHGVGFSVATPASTASTQTQPFAVRNVSMVPEGPVRGMVTYDGKGSTITAVSGSLTVRDARGTAQVATAGNAVHIPLTNGGTRAVPAQLVAEAGSDESAGEKKDKDPAAVIVGGGGVSPLVVAASAVVIEGGTYLAVLAGVNSGNHSTVDPYIASPSSFQSMFRKSGR